MGATRAKNMVGWAESEVRTKKVVFGLYVLIGRGYFTNFWAAKRFFGSLAPPFRPESRLSTVVYSVCRAQVRLFIIFRF